MRYIYIYTSGSYVEGRFYIEIRSKDTSYEANPGKEIVPWPKVEVGKLLRSIEFGCILDSQKDFPKN